LGGTPDRAVRPRPQSTSGRGPQGSEDTDSGSRPPEKDKSRERTCQQKRPVETFGEEPGPLGGFWGRVASMFDRVWRVRSLPGGGSWLPKQIQVPVLSLCGGQAAVASRHLPL